MTGTVHDPDQSLNEEEVFKHPTIEHGVVTWMESLERQVDCALRRNGARISEIA